ncbi:Hydroxymethylglutaryl-coenzyme A reductase [Planctomycetes bacterium Pla163]|uniref:Hydroxymethylglutaryl-coenzyme A reductase n=1 Tax=Rohdeia mirabilis TaxID=2528008 RepID=A0A518CX01_9BACT|nr:Hydroxymethylglutaryl-coenzyme A reductase [Planctomycetes bacterium Pla163]
MDEPLEKVPRDPADDFGSEAIARRRALAERAAGGALPHLAGAPVDPRTAAGNVENLIGYAQVPVGLAGPLRVVGAQGTYEVYVPLATTEGAMVASYSRGMAVARAAGGVRARVVKDGLSQHPMLVFEGFEAAVAARDVVAASFDELAAIASEDTRHGRLVSAVGEVVGRRLIVRLVFRTGDAIGINMAARATDRIARCLAERTGALECYVHGQDVEKRANQRALVEGRGRSVVAEVTLPAALVRERLRCEPSALAKIARSYAVGYTGLGTQNWTVQAANGLVALMIACGQDPAYVTESATGWLELEVTDAGELYAAVSLPSLLLGTVGGGSGKGTAAECLAILGASGAGKVERLAEVAGAMVLCGDLSLMASFVAGDFVSAHERLGRNRPGGSK